MTKLKSIDPVGPDKTDSHTFWLATDFHYLAEELIGDENNFKNSYAQRDGKVTLLCSKIIDAFIKKLKKAMPSALIIPGDLTYNGELASLTELLTKLKGVQKIGIPVLIIPGNHDIDYPSAYNFSGEKIEKTDNIPQRTFKDLCRPFGYEQAIFRCNHSFSYVYELEKNLWVIMIDSNSEVNPGTVGKETLKWLEEVLEAGALRGATMFTVTHQNLIKQNSLASTGYVLNDNDKTAELLRKYHVSANFSGHIHFTSMAEDNGITDIVTGALTVSPLQYSVITATTDGDAWTLNHHYEYIEEYQEHALKSICDSTRRHVAHDLINAVDSQGFNIDLGEDDVQRMTEFAVYINMQFFARQKIIMTDEYKEAWQLWKKYARNSSRYRYLAAALEGYV